MTQKCMQQIKKAFDDDIENFSGNNVERKNLYSTIRTIISSTRKYRFGLIEPGK